MTTAELRAVRCAVCGDPTGRLATEEQINELDRSVCDSCDGVEPLNGNDRRELGLPQERVVLGHIEENEEVPPTCAGCGSTRFVLVTLWDVNRRYVDEADVGDDGTLEICDCIDCRDTETTSQALHCEDCDRNVTHEIAWRLSANC